MQQYIKKSATKIKLIHKQFLVDDLTPITLYKKLVRNGSYSFLFESAEYNNHTGRYSILGFDPLEVIKIDSTQPDPFTQIEEALNKYQLESGFDLPVFQSGLVGYFSYETVKFVEPEKLKKLKFSKELPLAIFFLPKKVAIFDHCNNAVHLLATDKVAFAELEKDFNSSKTPLLKPISAISVSFNLASPEFEKKVNEAKEHIVAGDVFQLVLSRKFEFQTDLLPLDIYRNLRAVSPSSYMFYLDFPDFSIIGSSPETLVKKIGQKVMIKPIAGTRKTNIAKKAEVEKELLSDQKELAEHKMLVDLGRNDLGKIAVPNSIKIDEFMKVKHYSHVMHIVSTLTAQVSPNISAIDIFKAVFPAGTLSGAPKIKAMELINKFENEPRGIYGGAIGYFDFHGNMDFAIAIRTMLYNKSAAQISLRAGAGIVYDSIPANESNECMNKALGPLSAIASK